MKHLNFPNIPSSVYRLQFNQDFTLQDALKILPYLKKLGVEGVYCSPYFTACSPHGYDVANPNQLNPKIGTLEEYEEFCKQLKKLDLKHIIDVVPNHMGIKGGKNQWWQDVLENGPHSEFAGFFDINWNPEKKELQDRVLLPILGKPYGKALEHQEVKMRYLNGGFFFEYCGDPLPINSESYVMILETGLDLLKEKLSIKDPDWIEYQEILELYQSFSNLGDKKASKKREGRARLDALVTKSIKIKKHIELILSMYQGKKRQACSFDLLDSLLEAQFYRLSYWRVASHEINYRRFFNIHELVSIRIEEPEVLQSHHRWLFELLEAGHIQGMRIDHPDGLYDPTAYFENLRERFKVLTVVEKILDHNEKLPESWKVEGTVGYEYINLLNGVFVQQQSERQITEIYNAFIGRTEEFDDIVYRAKKLFTDYEMVSEVKVLGLKLDRLSEANREYRDFTRDDLTKALAELIACFPVYRTYIAPTGSVSKRDKIYIQTAIEKAKKKALDLDASIFDFLEKVLLLKLKTNPYEEQKYREFVLQFQQLTGPIMAKGLEDTAFYLYNRFISLNEVGGNPPTFGYSIAEFHKANLEKKEKWELGFLSTSTHDTKRNEDVRMRLNVLSEMPERWKLEVHKWTQLNSEHKREGPSLNAEYFIYQTLLGVWPKLKENRSVLCERIWLIILKSIREAKHETSWLKNNLAYEKDVHHFLFSILEERKSNQFLKAFTRFHQIIDRYGGWNSLSQTLLKIASPGIVDIYQGNELLTYRLADPDNRVPIDFEIRKKTLNFLKKEALEKAFTASELSKAKCFLTAQALHFRTHHKELFLYGEYIPLKTKGARKENIIAFMRKTDQTYCIVLAGRFYSQLAPADWDLPLGRHAWGDTEVFFPFDKNHSNLVDLFTGKNIEPKRKGNLLSLRLEEVFEFLPVSLLRIGQ